MCKFNVIQTETYTQIRGKCYLKINIDDEDQDNSSSLDCHGLYVSARGGASVYRRLIGQERRSRFCGRGLRSLWPRRICMAAASGQQTQQSVSSHQFHSGSFMHLHLVGKK